MWQNEVPMSVWPVFLPTLSSICPDNLSHLSDKRRSWSGNQISTFHIICSCVIINHNGTRFLLYIMKTECCGKKCIHSWKWLQPWWAPPWWLSGGHCARTQPCKILAQFNPCCAPSHRAARASAQGRFVSFIINCSLRWTKTERWNTDEQLQEGGNDRRRQNWRLMWGMESRWSWGSIIIWLEEDWKQIIEWGIRMRGWRRRKVEII